MYEMTDAERLEREEFKKIYRAAAELPMSRYRNLALGFIKGFKYRRVERNHHMQSLDGHNYVTSPGLEYVNVDGKWYYEHNLPSAYRLTQELTKCGAVLPLPPGKVSEAVLAWLKDRSGAIPAPPPRPKKWHGKVIEESSQSFAPSAE